MSGLSGFVAWLATCGVALPVRTAAQDSWNVELLSVFNPMRGARSVYNDIWGYTAPDGTELAIIGTVDAVLFVDVTDPRQPHQVALFQAAPTTHRDFRTHGHHAYAVNETAGGLAIYDLSNPRQPLQVGSFDSTFATSHNIGIYDGFAYVVGCRDSGGLAVGMRILDLSDPVHPVDVGAYTNRYVHDVFVRNDVAYCSTINDGGLTFVNVHDKANPDETGFRGYGGAHTHSAWTTEDGQYLLTTDETGGGHVRIWDLSAGTIQVAEWLAHPNASVHNVFVKGDTAYASYYTEGLRVLDISDPRSPMQVAFYDTWPGVSGGFNGNWGVYPFAASGNIYLSDMTSGLFVVRLTAGGPVQDFVLEAPPSRLGQPGQDLFFFFDLQNVSLRATQYRISATNSGGWSMTFPQTMTVPGSAADLVLVTVSVPESVSGVTRVGVELCVESQATGFSRCVSTAVAVPVVLQSFTAGYRENTGVVLEWQLDFGPEDSGQVVVLRSPALAPEAWEERARLDLGSGGHVDADVERGRSYVYSLAVDGPSGIEILGQRRVTVSTPAMWRLLGNRPNPFNPRTRIRFELARPGDVSLSVFDARGRRVRELVGRALPAGSHDLLWDGEDLSGNPQPSGVYFYEIRSHGWRARGRMTLAR